MKLTLCGSTRFREAFEDWNAGLTLMGHVVYSVACFGRESVDVGKPAENLIVTDEQKRLLDLIHLQKIDASDAIVVLNVGDYIGDSTRREILWAKMRSKGVFAVRHPSVNVDGATTVRVLADRWNDDPLPLIRRLDAFPMLKKYFVPAG